MSQQPGWPQQQPPAGYPQPLRGHPQPPGDASGGYAAPRPSRPRDGTWWWAMMPVLTAGLAAFVPALHAAIKLRRRNLWIAAGALTAAALFVMLMFAIDDAVTPQTPTGKPSDISVFGGFGAVVAIAAAAAGTALAFRLRAEVFDRAPGRSAQTQAVAAVQAARRRREEARELARRDPAMAYELRIGRPDLPRDYDDGGLVDLNHAPVDVLARDLELTDDQAQQIVTARTQLGALQHLSELTAYTSLPPALVDRITDRAVLLP